MKKIASAGSVVAAVVLGSMGVMGTAHADSSQNQPPQVSPPQSTTPQSSTVQSNDVSDNQVAAASESLPNTGGPDATLLGGALALLAAGGATVVVARRRQTI